MSAGNGTNSTPAVTGWLPDFSHSQNTGSSRSLSTHFFSPTHCSFLMFPLWASISAVTLASAEAAGFLGAPALPPVLWRELLGNHTRPVISQVDSLWTLHLEQEDPGW